MKTIYSNPFNTDFVVYVMGTDNYNQVKQYGSKCVLVNKDPFMFDIVRHQYRHKLEIIKMAMEEYDEILYLDWDCIPQKKLPNNYWDILGKKEVFQANLQIYHCRKCHWRKSDIRKVPNGGFIYIRDKSIPSKVIKLWESIGGDNDEPSWAKFTDDYVGGWQGIEKYWELFEPTLCNLHRDSPYSKDLLKSKNECFKHFQGK